MTRNIRRSRGREKIRRKRIREGRGDEGHEGEKTISVDGDIKMKGKGCSKHCTDKKFLEEEGGR